MEIIRKPFDKGGRLCYNLAKRQFGALKRGRGGHG